MPACNLKLITCILPKGIANNVIRALKEEKNILSGNINNARGIGLIKTAKFRGFGQEAEREILTVTVDVQRADEIFEFLFHKAEIDRPEGGLILVHELGRCTTFTLPDLPDET